MAYAHLEKQSVKSIQKCHSLLMIFANSFSHRFNGVSDSNLRNQSLCSTSSINLSKVSITLVWIPQIASLIEPASQVNKCLQNHIILSRVSVGTSNPIRKFASLKQKNKTKKKTRNSRNYLKFPKEEQTVK